MNSDNKIREQFQSKFDGFKAPLPADGWEGIEESLMVGTATNRLAVRRRWRYVGSAAAVLILLVGSLLFFNHPGTEEEPVLSGTSPTPASSDAEAAQPLVSMEDAIQPDQGSVQLFTERSVAKQEPASIQPSDPVGIFEDWLRLESLKGADAVRKVDSGHLVSGINQMEGEGQEIDFDALMEEFITIDGEQDELFADNGLQRKKEDGVILSLSGKGGLTSFYRTANSPMTLRSSAVSDDGPLSEEAGKMVFQTNSITDNIAEMEHDQPVSFGITVSKSLFNDVYVETGLVYSYLYSKSKNSNTNTRKRQTQSLHYLGVPLNVNYNLFSLKRLNVYASVGGMIEKDIYGKFQEESESQSIGVTNKSEEFLEETISQDNPQISVNAGIGLSYPLYKDLKLYGKIGGAYYFDANNEYKTIYSDRKIVMDLNLGIRYEF